MTVTILNPATAVPAYIDALVSVMAQQSRDEVEHGLGGGVAPRTSTTCAPTHSNGYTLAGTSACNTGTLTPSTSQANPSDAGSAHDNGAANDGTTSLVSGTTCTTTFSGGYTVSGTAACKAGTLTPVTCQVNPCDADYAPDYGAMNARPSLRPEPHTH